MSARWWSIRQVLSALILVAVAAGFGGAPAAAVSPGSAGAAPETMSAQRFAAASSEACVAGVNSLPVRPRQVDLVLDDSGSMFSDGARSLDRWSNAKYSLEVFAAMLGPDDLLKVYRMSDFAGTGSAPPAVTISGGEPASARVAKIHGMPMQGGGTPYGPVLAAMADLTASSVPDKWLVVLSDGEFDGRSTVDIERDFVEFVARNASESSGARVAFLGIGADAPRLAHNPASGVYTAQARETSELLGVMTGFSNRIFARSILAQTSPGRMSPDADLDEMLVFAQGGDVEITSLTAGGAVLEPASIIEVSWTDNPDIRMGGSPRAAVPNTALHGVLASYRDVPSGSIVVDAEAAKTIDVFYTPRAAFGIELRDADGRPVAQDKVVGGEYTIEFGFMDRECRFIESDLFGDVRYTAEVSQNGEVTSTAVASGDRLALERGQAQFRVEATYLEGNVSEATIDLTVLRPPKPTSFEAVPKVFLASELDDYSMPDDAMRLRYAIAEGAGLVDFTAEEWASVTADSFVVTSQTDGILFDVAVGEAPGEVYLLPRAPGGEPLDAAVGEIPVMLSASHVYDEQLNEATYELVVTIEDDISVWDRFLHWLWSVGWMWMLLLLLVVWVLGYFVRPTFSRRIKASPTITFKPKQRGKRSQVKGKFEKSRFSALIPYRARTATLAFAPRGFAKMKLKARRGGRIEIQNWKQFTQHGNVRINGESLNKETTRPPSLRPASSITAIGRDGTYDMTLNA